MPTYIILLTTPIIPSSVTADLIFSRILIGLVLLAAFADQQQWNYQTAKSAYKDSAKVPKDSPYTAEDFDRGFNVTGLWAWSRHPNFAAEQATWVALYQWSCWLTGSYWNWSIVGPAMYLILFRSSTIFTEYLSAGKYPEYKEYQARVGMFIPRWSLEPRGGFENTKAEAKKE